MGDRVWAFTLLHFGCYAQRTCLPATLTLLTPAPSNLSQDEAAAIPYGGLMALHFLDDLIRLRELAEALKLKPKEIG